MHSYNNFVGLLPILQSRSVFIPYLEQLMTYQQVSLQDW